MKLTETLARARYRAYLNAGGYAKSTQKLRRQHLGTFFAFLKTCGMGGDLREVSRNHIRDYLWYLDRLKSLNRRLPLAAGTKQMMLLAVKQLFHCLYTTELILINPAQDFKVKRQEGGRRAVLSQEEMARLLDGIDGQRPKDLRDRVLFELMYSSGLRVSEATRLMISDLDVERRMVLIRQGKGSKDRIEPVSEVAMRFLVHYLGRRLSWGQEYVFPGQAGHLQRDTVNRRFKQWAARAGIKRKNLSIHSIRHSVATHLLENGAGIRYVQELLGHEYLQSTVRYTHSLYENLKRIYKSHHPRENEYYREVDEAYRKRLADFTRRLKRRRVRSEKDRVYRQRRG